MNTKNDRKIVLTGGHAGATGYATIQELKDLKYFSSYYWFGAKTAVEGKKNQPLEKGTLPGLGVHYIPITTGRIQRKFSIWTIPSLLKIPIGFLYAFYWLRRIKPNVILSFGGYVGFPVVMGGWLLKIPIVIHEQTCAAGRANVWSSHFAKKIAISRESSRSYFPSGKCVLTGNPISKEVATVTRKSSIKGRPTILITGGSRGSVPINNVITMALEALLDRYTVLHQTGNIEYNKFVDIRKSLSTQKRDKYMVFGQIPSHQWYSFLEKADIVITRAGANIVSELLVVKRPALFIPLPFAYEDEQRKNAFYAKDFGIGEVLEQKDLTKESLLRNVDQLIANWNRYINNTKSKPSPDIKAARNLAKLTVDVSK